MRIVKRTLPVLPAALALLAAGCGASIDTSPANLPTPSIARGADFTSCTAAGTSARLELSDVGTRVTLGYGALPPENRVDVTGTATGLGASDVVHVAIIPVDSDCPVLEDVDATVAADGTFTARLDIGNLEDFRLIAFALPDDTLPIVGCAAGGTCVDTSGVAPSGVANTLEIRIE